MPAEATTEGSIVAYLRLNDSDWNAKIDAAEAKARELGRIDPDIRVTADTADAIAKLEAVKEVEDRVGGTVTTVSRVERSVSETTSTHVDSNAALQAAQERVLAAAYAQADEAVDRLKRDQEADNEAMRQASTLALKESIMMEALAAAERNAADGADKHVEAQKKMAGAADQTSNSFQGLQGHTALIAAGIAALIPLAAPLGGFLLGMSGAWAGMGAAGVLALMGIGHEMEADTALGNQFQDGVATLKDDLHQLEATAAAGVIKPFNDALSYLQPQMPRINQDMGAMAHWVGQIAATSVTTVVAGFEALEPLMVAGEKVTADWAHNMALFASSPEFRQFINYAITELPQVNSLLINLGGTVIHIVDAFTPLGTAIIPVLSAISYGFNAIPTPVLTGLAAGALAVGGAFVVWNYAIQPLLTKMGILAGEEIAVAAGADAAAGAEDAAAAAATGWGAALDFALGPVGIVIGIVAALVGGMMAASAATQSATAAQTDFTAAIQADNGAIRQHVAAQAAKQLADQGGFDAAKQLGIGNDLVTKAVLGQGNAYKSLTGQLEHIVATSKLTAGAHQGNASALTSEGKAAQTLLGQIKNLNGTLGSQLATNQQFAGAAIAAGDAAQALASDENTLEDASKSADSATQGYIDALEKYAKSAGTAADKGAFLGASLVSMQGDWLSYDGALANAAYANYTLTQTFQDQGKQVSQGVKFIRDTEKAAIDLNTGLIDVTKSGAPALISQLTAMQTAAEKAAEATYTHEVATKGAGQAAADAAAIFKGDTYDALLKDADQLGITAGQAQKLGDQYFALPSDVITKLQTEGQSTVVQTLDAIGEQLAEISGHPWTSTLDANGVPLSHEAFQAQQRLNDIHQLKPADVKADAARAHMTVDQFTQHLQSIKDKDVRINADTAAAQANLLAVGRTISSLNSKTVTLTVLTNNVGAPVNVAVPPRSGAVAQATGGPVMYRAIGGGIDYLAAGSDFWKPQGTDTVPTMLTPGEFVTKEQSARYDPPFMKAYNDNPAAALAAVRAGGGPTVVSLKGAVLVMQVDGRQFTAVIQDQIVAANRQQTSGFRAGMQKGAY